MRPGERVFVRARLGQWVRAEGATLGLGFGRDPERAGVLFPGVAAMYVDPWLDPDWVVFAPYDPSAARLFFEARATDEQRSAEPGMVSPRLRQVQRELVRLGVAEAAATAFVRVYATAHYSLSEPLPGPRFARRAVYPIRVEAGEAVQAPPGRGAWRLVAAAVETRSELSVWQGEVLAADIVIPAGRRRALQVPALDGARLTMRVRGGPVAIRAERFVYRPNVADLAVVEAGLVDLAEQPALRRWARPASADVSAPAEAETALGLVVQAMTAPSRARVASLVTRAVPLLSGRAPALLTLLLDRLLLVRGRLGPVACEPPFDATFPDALRALLCDRPARHRLQRVWHQVGEVDDGIARRLARAAVRNALHYQQIANGGPAFHVEVAERRAPTQRCRVTSNRWRVLRAEGREHPIRVPDQEIQLRVHPGHASWHGPVQIGEWTLNLDGSRTTRVHMPPGNYALSLPEGSPPLLGRFGAGSEAPCRDVVEVTTGSNLEEVFTYHLTREESAFGFVRLVFRARRPIRVRYQVGDARGRMELPAGDTEVHLAVPPQGAPLRVSAHPGRGALLQLFRPNLQSARPSSNAPAAAAEESANAEAGHPALPPRAEPLPAREPGPFTLSLRNRAVMRELRDLDSVAGGTPYIETRPGLHISADQVAFVTVGLPIRFRDGGPSFGASLRLETEAEGFRPRLTAGAQVMMQSGPKGLNVVPRVEATAQWLTILAPGIAILPLIGTRWVQVASTARLPASQVDPDIYTTFDDAHPLHLEGGFVFSVQPTRDFLFRAFFRLRTNSPQDSDVLDRVNGRVRFDLSPGGTWGPWFGVEYRLSQRFDDRNRGAATGQHRFRFETHLIEAWFSDHRLHVGGQVEMYNTRAPLLTGFLTLGYLWSPGRGLRDFSERQIRNRADRERGLSPLFF